MADTNRISIGETEAPNARVPRVVIVGAGFGGLAAAKALGKAPVQVILIDRTNHRLRLPRGAFFLTTGTCVAHFS